MTGDVIDRCPDVGDKDRLRRVIDQLRIYINGLARGGNITRGGPGTESISLTVNLASPSGLEYSTGALRIDLDTTILALASTGLEFAKQSKNLLLSGPASGVAAVPTFRSIVGADLGTGTADTTTFLRGDLSWQPSGGIGTDPISSIYPGFTAAVDDDEFDNNSFTGWTAVNGGSHLPTLTEANNAVSVSHPGGDAAAELHAWMKSRTIAANDYVEMAFRSMGVAQNYNICGLVMADGTTYGAGNQVLWLYSPNEGKWGLNSHSHYDTFAGTAGYNVQTQAPFSDMFLRLKYEGSNHWRGYTSADGISWIDVTGQITYTLTPTKVGFFVSTWGGAAPHVFSIRYVRFGP